MIKGRWAYESDVWTMAAPTWMITGATVGKYKSLHRKRAAVRSPLQCRELSGEGSAELPLYYPCSNLLSSWTIFLSRQLTETTLKAPYFVPF